MTEREGQVEQGKELCDAEPLMPPSRPRGNRSHNGRTPRRFLWRQGANRASYSVPSHSDGCRNRSGATESDATGDGHRSSGLSLDGVTPPWRRRTDEAASDRKKIPQSTHHRPSASDRVLTPRETGVTGQAYGDGSTTPQDLGCTGDSQMFWRKEGTERRTAPGGGETRSSRRLSQDHEDVNGA